MVYHKINKVLIANRGEIALRIQRSCQRLGIGCAITISEADKNLAFARFAEEPAYITGLAAKDCYLSIPKIIEAAKKAGCDAIHPGYGFLSEQKSFAKAIEKEGLIFIGPRSECMEAMGDKLLARQQAFQNDVPCLPGLEISQVDEKVFEKLTQIGFPLLIKAAAGGGGRGMRVARNQTELKELLPVASSEAEKFFSDGRLYVERFLDRPRHVEVQVFGDNFGNVIHLGTRDCSMQRRHQKLIEEAPASGLSSTLEKNLLDAAVRLTKSVAYNNAGTLEFLVDGEEFYFLEMNTRIQVEHPVSESITNLDLIELQIRVAQGEALPVSQAEVTFSGHAIEFRVYAEDPLENFLPVLGTIEAIHRPNTEYLREDFAVSQGDKLSPYYDALLTKLIITANSREEALARSRNVVRSYKIDGMPTTLDFHRWVLDQKDFSKCPQDIAYVSREFLPNIQELKATKLQKSNAKSDLPTGFLKRDLLLYQSLTYSLEYEIELLQLEDSSFVAIPKNSDGKRAKEEYCRRAWQKEEALQALRDEILELKRPEEIF